MADISHERGRITARVPASVQELLEEAASLVGATLNQFLVQSALREAERIIEQERAIRLRGQEAEAFLAALDKPAQPNEKLLAALKDYTERRHDQTGALDWAPRPKRV